MKARGGKLGGVRAQSPAVGDLAFYITHACKVEVTREHVFSPRRRFAFDIAIPKLRIGVEVDGGGFRKGGGLEIGGHSSGTGHRRDVEKDGEALLCGWLVVRCLPEHVSSGDALRWVEAAIKQRGDFSS